MNASAPQAKPAYGWDAPGIMLGFIAAGVALVGGSAQVPVVSAVQP
jgi:hypothetical protein